MKIFIYILSAIVLLILITFLFVGDENMELTSDAFENGGQIPSEYTCDGENISPPLAISDIPENTKSLVLIMDDPDAVKPAGKVWDHWVVWNIPENTEVIEENSIPENSIQGLTSFENNKYGGPCPPDGEHMYLFKLYALDVELDIPETSTKLEVENAMKDHIIETSELIGRYQKV